MFLPLLSSRLSGRNSSPAWDLHGVPGVLFECSSTPLHTISGPVRDFHLRPKSHSYSTSCSDRKVTEKNTQKEANGELKCVYSAHLRQTVCTYLVFHFAWKRTTKDFPSFHSLFQRKAFINSHAPANIIYSTLLKHTLNKL